MNEKEVNLLKKYSSYEIRDIFLILESYEEARQKIEVLEKKIKSYEKYYSH